MAILTPYSLLVAQLIHKESFDTRCSVYTRDAFLFFKEYKLNAFAVYK
jgi:hypothetical protein